MLRRRWRPPEQLEPELTRKGGHGIEALEIMIKGLEIPHEAVATASCAPIAGRGSKN